MNVLWDGVLIYLFIYSHFAAIDVFKFFFFFPHLHSPDAWRTASVVAAVEADISGVCGWSFLSETKSAVAQRFFRCITRKNDFCFLLNGSCKSSLSHFLICCVAAPSVNSLGMIIDLHEKCMTLLVSCRTRDFQTVFPIVRTLSVAWVTKICFDTCGNWSFFWNYIYSADRFNHIIHLSMTRNAFGWDSIFPECQPWYLM